jgi:hypothetical protein
MIIQNGQSSMKKFQEGTGQLKIKVQTGFKKVLNIIRKIRTVGRLRNLGRRE